MYVRTQQKYVFYVRIYMQEMYYEMYICMYAQYMYVSIMYVSVCKLTCGFFSVRVSVGVGRVAEVFHQKKKLLDGELHTYIHK